MGDRTAFFYGTLMAREILHRVIYGSANPSLQSPTTLLLSRQLTITPAILQNYCRHKVAGCDYPGIIPEEGKEVRGTYVTGLTEGDVWRLDAFEGGEYERRKIKVKLLLEGGNNSGKGKGEGQHIETESYVYTAGEWRLERKEWDYEEFRREKMFRWADSSEEYKEVDDAVNGQGAADPTGGRGILSEGNKEEEKLRSAV